MVDSVIPRIYTGEKKPSAEERELYGLEPYIPSLELVEAVNLTIFLKKRPLLLKGEPGSGKTRLARAVAYELGLPYESWYIQSTTKAKDGCYTYDAIARLHDAQLARLDEQKLSKVDNLWNYIKLGPLGRAFENSQRTVILIDEIDKADLDFPNDLLQVLDEKRFTIPEIKVKEKEAEKEYEIKTKEPPIIFITSNDEKDLPDAFLRRCLFHYIEFPKYAELVNIINEHFPNTASPVVVAATKKFQELRDEMDNSRGRTGKNVSTSELIDWFTILRQYPEDELLAKLQGELPFAETLLKDRWINYREYLRAPQQEKK
ncbi:AAA family ATPase [Planktothrix paucivesiculata]|uniref:ATPase associated with various cellular activities, AAA_5 n=1 Tax=Planktothrix paucivesiculata PCC 9631 TaxID=671071 RepID=A0A7Z9BSB3_9CYAN|nr:MoxR family ATPase [Planktothrix paucivesiculata]VXD16696.1 ATPase associated with various cellular activities, AAA_5 [Planktothrix paucivesiculata PCC 9631]